MKIAYSTILRFFSLGLLFLIIVDSTVAYAANKKKTTDQLQSYQNIDWSKYTVAAVRNKVPKKMQGQDVSFLPVQGLYFLPEVNLVEMNRVWKSAGHPWPKAIVLANGVYNLKKIARLVNDSNLFKKINKHTYISYRPIYIAPTATLVINTGELRLSLNDGSFVLANGKLFVVDSVITSWDEATGNYGVRETIPEKELLFYGNQFPRPYLFMIDGSEIYAANSTFRGLGYKGQMGSFGLSMTNRLSKESPKVFDEYLRNLKKPTGWLIGNTFEYNYFGYYSNGAENVVILGNTYLDNFIYNIDPHDFSTNLLIARNLSYQAQHAHGIIISREVNKTIIAENLVLKNKGSGIMLDRNCEHNLIFNNLSIENDGDGIAIFESDNNLLLNNMAARNGHTGIVMRNSCDITVQSNELFRNVKAGTEVAVLDIDYLETRDFVMDHYHQSASVSLLDNTFDSNVGTAINSHNKPGIWLKDNHFNNSGTSYYSGDLQSLSRKILLSPADKGFRFEGENACQ